jgi:hypothetical protein
MKGERLAYRIGDIVAKALLVVLGPLMEGWWWVKRWWRAFMAGFSGEPWE